MFSNQVNSTQQSFLTGIITALVIPYQGCTKLSTIAYTHITLRTDTMDPITGIYRPRKGTSQSEDSLSGQYQIGYNLIKGEKE